MARYGAGLSRHPDAAAAVGESAGAVLEDLDGGSVQLAVAFVSPHHLDDVEAIVPAIRGILEPEVLLLATTVAVVGGSTEAELEPAVSVLGADFDGARIAPVVLSVTAEAGGLTLGGWPSDTEWATTLLLLADPFTFPAEGFLERLRAENRDLRVVGGLASAAQAPGGNRLALDARTFTDGAVGVLLDGDVPATAIVSQGCRPIGQPFVVTRANGNRVEELGGAPAVQRLREMVETASDDERAMLQRGLHVGVVVDEHKAEFERGDFLVRGIVGAHEESGALSVGADVAVGQTLQFHVRDAASADEDLRIMLSGAEASAAMLFTCNGRGRNLFGTPDHDAGLIQEAVGAVPVAGGFFAGEFGPVGGESHLHGFTASTLLFT